MQYSPLDIKNQEFHKSVRGYNVDEVQIYLESLADFLAEISSENERLKNEIIVVVRQLEEYKKIERELQNTLLSAQESSSKSVESAKKQTELQLKESEMKAAQIVDKAREEANFIRNSVLNLKEERLLYIAKLKAMVDSQKKLLNLNADDENEAEKENEKKDSANPESSKGGIDVDDILDKIL